MIAYTSATRMPILTDDDPACEDRVERVELWVNLAGAVDPRPHKHDQDREGDKGHHGHDLTEA
ncbi:MAG: hypothetical protein ACR2NH_06640 [Solirubrobacteraceae bacterium]